MAIPVLPTYSAGQILTSDDMNDVSTLGNYQGLFWIKSQTIGSAVSSVAVTSAFSSDFDNYRIIIIGGASSAAATYLTFALTGGTSVYDQSFLYGTYAGAAPANAGVVSGASWSYAGTGQSTAGLNMVLEIQQPFLTRFTMFSAPIDNFELAGHSAGRHRSTTSFTGFTIAPASGTLTGGTIRVYGYRNSL